MKKSILVLATLFSVGLTMAMPLVASAREPNSDYHNFPSQVEYRHHERYQVYYRRAHHHRWRLEGSYGHRHDAERAARRLERQGYITHIERMAYR
jgi:hypothetical protein